MDSTRSQHNSPTPHGHHPQKPKTDPREPNTIFRSTVVLTTPINTFAFESNLKDLTHPPFIISTPYQTLYNSSSASFPPSLSSSKLNLSCSPE